MVSTLDWLLARPIAHRGLHDARRMIENTASAVSAAIEGGYGVEVDLQVSGDGEAMVHHDFDLGRLTEGGGALAALLAADLRRVRFKATSDHMLTLGELCDLVGGRATLVLELKSRFDGDSRLALRAAAVLKAYPGPVAAMSFDPDLVAALRHAAPGLARGIVAERRYNHPDWGALTQHQKRRLAFPLHAPTSRPMFVAYAVDDLPAVAPWVARTVCRLPLIAWTVRTAAQQRRARRWADQMIFEGIRP